MFTDSQQDLRREVLAGAACAGEDPEIFQADPLTNPATVLEALSVCAFCPVRSACLELAMSDPYCEFGVWGGATEDERRKMRRELLRGRQTGCPAPLAAPASTSRRSAA